MNKINKLFHKKKKDKKNAKNSSNTNDDESSHPNGKTMHTQPSPSNPSSSDDEKMNHNKLNLHNGTKLNKIAEDQTQTQKQNGYYNKKNGNMIKKTQTMPAMNSNKNGRSHDDMSADDMMKKAQKMRARGTKKRHSHIGAMRHHSSKLKKTNLDLPNTNNALIDDDDEYDDYSDDDDDNKKSVGKYITASTMNTMMSSSATNKRLEQLMNMRSGKDAKGNRSRSVNVNKKKQQEAKYPKKRRPKIHEEVRRHSMFPDKEKGTDKHEQHLKDRRKTIIEQHKYKRVQYRVKNELFVVYDYYQPVRIIGSGAYAVVCEAINTVTGKKLAIKKNKGVFDHITDARRILREIKLLMHFDHQDIIQLVDVIPCDSTDIDSFNDVYLVMPKMETTLAKVIRSKQKLTDRHYQFFMYQMLRGLAYMHSANVIHRDLKPENILINGADCNVKITDFGLARGVCKDDNIEKPTEYVVTRWYRSPEVMCSAGFYDEKVDIWSLGCIFAELILRRPLFPGQNYLDQLKIIFEVMGTPKDLTWIKTPEAKRWVQKLKPHDGKPLNTVFEKASEGALELLSVMLAMDPIKRYSSLQCLRHPYLKELHRKEDEVQCPPFDLSFEFEKAIKTKFGVRHMMYDALTSFQKTLPIQKPFPKNKTTTKKKPAPPPKRKNSKNNDTKKKDDQKK